MGYKLQPEEFALNTDPGTKIVLRCSNIFSSSTGCIVSIAACVYLSNSLHLRSIPSQVNQLSEKKRAKISSLDSSHYSSVLILFYFKTSHLVDIGLF